MKIKKEGLKQAEINVLIYSKLQILFCFLKKKGLVEVGE